MTTPVRVRRRPRHRPELAALTGTAATRLTAAWALLAAAQTRLLRRLAPIRPGPGVAARIRAALADFNAAVAEFDRTARGIVERWAAQDLPTAYRDGALRALAAIDRPAATFRWTRDHQATITATTAVFYTDLIGRITEAVRRAHAFARAATDAARTPQGANPTALREQWPLDTIVYANDARHPVRSWADAALRYQGIALANSGAINVSVWDLGCQWLQVVDGPDCGFRGHEDSDHADGTLRSAPDAAEWPTSHFGCIREWIPRPDLTDRPGLTSGDLA